MQIYTKILSQAINLHNLTTLPTKKYTKTCIITKKTVILHPLSITEAFGQACSNKFGSLTTLLSGLTSLVLIRSEEPLQVNLIVSSLIHLDL